ncbi:MAG: site-specific DNA-methyltransferase [Chromatiales bacterium]|nr:site-specific DNA-methyltransferase [Chromatiales bacterium]
MPLLDFKGKSIIYTHHLSVPFKALKVDEKKSMPPKNSKGKKQEPSLDDNLIINGDNLHALKSLLPRYAGKIKCIYIDPPYNTGNEGWKYNDNVNDPLLTEWLKNEVGVDDLERHDKWLCMMWPRLQLLKELLSEDGVIFVSIGSDEIHNLINMLNEIFQTEKPLATFIWKKRSGVNDSKNFISEDHDYIICYSKTEKFVLRGIKKDFHNYDNPDNDPRGPWTKGDLTCNKTKEERPNLFYTIKDPKTGNRYKCNPDRVWGTDKKGMEKLISQNKVIFPLKKGGAPGYKRHLSEVRSDRKPISTLIEQVNKNSSIDELNEPTIMQTHMNNQATEEISSIFGRKIFDYPKPKKLIEDLIFQSTNQDDTILDSFAGSGTTAHAVLALNKEDGGNRKFILVECEQYANTITAERVRRVIKGVPQAKDENLKNGLGGSFTYCTLGEEISKENLLQRKSLPSYDTLAKYVFYTATGQSLRSLTQRDDFYIAKLNDGTAFFVIYQPKSKFLRSNDSALNLDRKKAVQKIMKRRGCSKAVVFATACFCSQKELSKANISFSRLPFAIYKIVR